MEVSEIMTPNPESADVTESIRSVLMKLIELDVRHIPIVEEGELVGMISDRDLRTYLLPSVSELETANNADARFDRPISSVMQGDVLSVNLETEVGEVIDLMIDQRIGALPVIDAINGTLMGIVSYIDVLRISRELFED